jgi:hypothetical protein
MNYATKDKFTNILIIEQLLVNLSNTEFQSTVLATHLLDIC